MGEEIFVKLRECFQAGYTLPQYCVDNGIKKPLFVSEKIFQGFLWDVYIQFFYDKRLSPQFCFIDVDETPIDFTTSKGLNGILKVENFSKMNLNDFDKIILLTQKKIDLNTDKVIRLANLIAFFRSRTYVDIPVLNFLHRYPKVKFFLTNFGNRNVSKKIIMQSSWDSKELRKTLKSTENPVRCFDKFDYTNEQVLKLIGGAKAIKHLDGTTLLAEDNHPLIQIHDGKRMTAYQPKSYLNRIYIFGTCHQYGVNAPFDKTIASYLQKMINESGLPYRVENEGQFYSRRTQDIYYNLNKLDPAPGDIIFFYLWGIHSTSDKNVIPFCDVSDAFNSTDYREIYCVDTHVNEIAYKLLAEKYFKFLTENNFFRDIEFKYPPPQSTLLPPFRYTAAIRDGQFQNFRQRGA